MQETADRGDGDTDRGDEDQRALDSRGEVLGLAMTVRVFLVRRAGRDGQHRERHERAREVHQ